MPKSGDRPAPPAERGLAISVTSERLLAAARERIDGVPRRPGLLVVAATRGAAREFLYAAVGATGGWLGATATTLADLAAELSIAALATEGRVPVSSLGAEALAARAAAACSERGELAYFDEVAPLPGFAATLSRTLVELGLWRVDVDELAASGSPGRDLARLTAAYRQSLESFGLADRATVLDRASEVAGRQRHRLAGRAMLLIDPPLAGPAEQELCARLVARSPWAYAFCLAGDQAARAAWERIVDVQALDLDAAGDQPASRLERVRRFVFDTVAPPATGDEAEDGSVRFIAAPGEARECVEIARQARALAAEGVAFDRMAVLLRDPSTYLAVVEEALGRAAVPAYYSSGSIRPDPAGRAFLALLTCAAEDLSASRFAEYLSLGQVPRLEPSGAPPVGEPDYVVADDPQLSFKFVDEGKVETPSEGPAETHELPAPAGSLRAPFQWEKLLVDAAVVGGHDRWERRLGGLEAELLRQLRHLGEEDEPRRARLVDQLERLRHLKRFALPVIGFLGELPPSARWGEWLERLERLAALALRHPERVLSLLAELRPMRDVGPVRLDEVSRTLAARLTQLRAEPPASRYGRIFVGTVAEARGRSFEVVFLPGLAEGSFPRRSAEDPLLLDEFRGRLAAGLPTRRERLAEERLLLRLAAAAAARRLVVSYPSLDRLVGRARVPSFYALDLLRAAEGRLPDLGSLERRAADASEAVLGWPAARNPEQAIDDAEFDLSVLEPLLRAPGERARGGARYLLEVSGPLGRSLRWRARRWRNFFSSADGLVEPGPEAAHLLRGQHPRRRSYSPTALQTFAACPYRFLLHAVHRLRPRRQAVPLEQLDPLTRGSLFHEAQFALFGALREAGLLPVTAATREETVRIADRVLDEVEERYREELAPAIPRVWRVELDNLRIDFRGWIEQMVLRDGGWRPVRFEWAFGLPHAEGRDDASSESPAVVLDGYPVRGAIDLIEQNDDGALRVTDHKTGKPRPERALVVGGGEVLQPLLYGLAAEALLELPVKAGRLSWCTRRGGYRALEVPLGDYQKLQLARVLEIVGEAVDNGFLPAAPRQGACAYCDYRPVCGPHEEQRATRKKRQPLAALAELRKLD